MSTAEVKTTTGDNKMSTDAAVKTLKAVNMAFDLPVVTSAYAEMARIASPITVPISMTISPMVAVGMETIRNTLDESVIPFLPESVTRTAHAAKEQVSAAVDIADTLACGGIELLTESVPTLKEATPKLIQNTKESTTSYLTVAAHYMASYSVAQVGLKIVDSGLDVVEQALSVTVPADSLVSSSMKVLHTTANTIRLNGNKKAGTEKARKIEEASIVGAMLEAFGFNFMLQILGLKITKTVYEDEHARVLVDTKDDAPRTPIIVDTN